MRRTVAALALCLLGLGALAADRVTGRAFATRSEVIATHSCEGIAWLTNY